MTKILLDCSLTKATKDVDVLSKVVAECLKTSNDVIGSAQQFIADAKRENDRAGLSLFEVRNRDLLSYMNEVCHLMCQMSFGESIQNCNALERSVFLRTVLERIRPIEQKLRPYVEKTMSASIATSSSKQVLRPRPELMKVGDEDDENDSEDSGEEGDTQQSSMKKYVPPKIVALRYDEDEKAKEERLVERARRRALQSSLINDLRAQYSEAPEEVEEDRRNRKVREKDLEKQKYEEDYMIRLQMNKKEQHERRLENRQNVLDELLHFGDYMAVDESTRSKKPTSSLKRRKHTSGGASKGKRYRDGMNRSESMKSGHKKVKKRFKK